MSDKFKLLSGVEGGCSSKIPPDLLELALAPLLKQKIDSNLMSDVDIGDDAGVYKISDDLSIVFTVDYFPPIVEDPYEFGQIAACNSISDIYAMGAKPKLALNITLFPKDDNLEMLTEMLRGGQDKASEAGAIIVGGHTITDQTAKYGLSVIGFAHPDEITTNSDAKAGDTLILTKPLGTACLLASLREGLMKRSEMEDIFISMKTLNDKAATIMNEYKIKSATDITGFGLIGHAHKMALASDVTIEIDSKSLPLFENAYKAISMGAVPNSSFTNMRYVGEHALYSDTLDYNLKMIVCDAQTSGGMMMCVKSHDAENVLASLWRAGLKDSIVIGHVLEKSDYTIKIN